MRHMAGRLVAVPVGYSRGLDRRLLRRGREGRRRWREMTTVFDEKLAGLLECGGHRSSSLPVWGFGRET